MGNCLLLDNQKNETFPNLAIKQKHSRKRERFGRLFTTRVVKRSLAACCEAHFKGPFEVQLFEGVVVVFLYFYFF